LTVSLRPLVPSSRRAASSACSSTSTVVRVIGIRIEHLAAVPGKGNPCAQLPVAIRT
jgi:hypothetical protein